MGPRESPGALEKDSLLLRFFAVTFNPCRGWRMLYFWSWLFIWGGYCWLWPQGVDLRSKYYRFLSEASRSLCQGPSLLSRILGLARLAVLPCSLSQGRRKPGLGDTAMLCLDNFPGLAHEDPRLSKASAMRFALSFLPGELSSVGMTYLIQEITYTPPSKGSPQLVATLHKVQKAVSWL